MPDQIIRPVFEILQEVPKTPDGYGLVKNRGPFWCGSAMVLSELLVNVLELEVGDSHDENEEEGKKVEYFTDSDSYVCISDDD